MDFLDRCRKDLEAKQRIFASKKIDREHSLSALLTCSTAIPLPSYRNYSLVRSELIVVWSCPFEYSVTKPTKCYAKFPEVLLKNPLQRNLLFAMEG
jgi:hypothetical protein